MVYPPRDLPHVSFGFGSAGALRGTVMDTKHRPLPGLFVRVWVGGRAILSATTDLNGNYAVSDVAPGSYTLTFEDGPTVVLTKDVEVTARHVTYSGEVLPIARRSSFRRCA